MSRFRGDLSAVNVRYVLQVSEKETKLQRRDTKQNKHFFGLFFFSYFQLNEVKLLSGLIICSSVRSIDPNTNRYLFANTRRQ